MRAEQSMELEATVTKDHWDSVSTVTHDNPMAYLGFDKVAGHITKWNPTAPKSKIFLFHFRVKLPHFKNTYTPSVQLYPLPLL